MTIKILADKFEKLKEEVRELRPLKQKVVFLEEKLEKATSEVLLKCLTLLIFLAYKNIQTMCQQEKQCILEGCILCRCLVATTANPSTSYTSGGEWSYMVEH
jgi:hypothetical protein